MQHGIAGMFGAIKVELAVHVMHMGAYAAGKGGTMEMAAMGVLDVTVITVVRLLLIGTAGMLVEAKVTSVANVTQ